MDKKERGDAGAALIRWFQSQDISVGDGAAICLLVAAHCIDCIDDSDVRRKARQKARELIGLSADD